MSAEPEPTMILLTVRRWVAQVGDIAGHYATPVVQLTFPADYLVQYEPTQHTVIIKAPGGQVRAAYRDVTQLLTPGVIEEVNR